MDFGNEDSGSFADVPDNYFSSDSGNQSSGGFNNEPFSERSNNGGWDWGPSLAAGGVGAILGAAAMSARNNFNRRQEYSSEYYVPNPQRQYEASWQTSTGPQAYPVLSSRSPTSSAARHCVKLLPLVNVGVVFVVVYLLFYSFRTETLSLAAKEQRLMQANSFFVTGIKISASDSTPPGLVTSVLQFPHIPPLTEKMSFQQNPRNVEVRGYGYESWKFWLNQGSTITLNYHIERNSNLLFLVIKGTSRLDGWKYSPTTFTDYEMRRSVSGDNSIKFTADSHGLYYFAFGNFNRYSRKIYALDINVESRMFDLSLADKTCSMPPSSKCTLGLDWGSERVGILQTPLENANGEAWKVTLSYNIRWTTFFWIIVATWMSTYIVGKAYRRREARQQMYPQYAQTSQSVSPPDPPPHTPVFVAPDAPSAPPEPVPQGKTSMFGRLFSSANRAEGSPPSDNVPNLAPIPSTWVRVESGGENRPLQVDRYEVQHNVPSGSTMEPAKSYNLYDGAFVKSLGSDTAEESVVNSGRDSDACVICMDSKKDSIIVECGHRATCYTCGQMLMQVKPSLCPICRKEIRQVIKVYDA